MSALVLTRDDITAMFVRALMCCPDIYDDEAVMQHLHHLGLAVSQIGATAFDALLDEVRVTRFRKAPHAF